MTALGTFFIIAAVVAVTVPVVVRQIRRARASTQVFQSELDARLLLHELNLHLDQYLLDHPDVAAGFDRLRAAIRDEQQNGDQA